MRHPATETKRQPRDRDEDATSRQTDNPPRRPPCFTARSAPAQPHPARRPPNPANAPKGKGRRKRKKEKGKRSEAQGNWWRASSDQAARRAFWRCSGLRAAEKPRRRVVKCSCVTTTMANLLDTYKERPKVLIAHTWYFTLVRPVSLLLAFAFALRVRNAAERLSCRPSTTTWEWEAQGFECRHAFGSDSAAGGLRCGWTSEPQRSSLFLLFSFSLPFLPEFAFLCAPLSC
eukprot:scaffold7363_cov263-Pinguiococcus_pyrenoidosus.AAC.11